MPLWVPGKGLSNGSYKNNEPKSSGRSTEEPRLVGGKKRVSTLTTEASLTGTRGSRMKKTKRRTKKIGAGRTAPQRHGTRFVEKTDVPRPLKEDEGLRDRTSHGSAEKTRQPPSV